MTFRGVGENRETFYGVALRIFGSTDPDVGTEVERRASTSASDVERTWRLPPGERRLKDDLPRTASKKFYRARGVGGECVNPSTFTDFIGVEPEEIGAPGRPPAPPQGKAIPAATTSPDAVSDRVQKLTGGGDALNTIFVGGFSPGRHIVPGTAKDGESVTFGQSYDTTPKFTFVPQVGRVSIFSASTDQRLDMKAQDASVSGFDLRAKVITGTNFSAQTDGFSSTRNTGSPENGSVTLSTGGAAAFSNLEDANSASATYTGRFDVNRSPSSGSPGSITPRLEYSDASTGGSWTEGDSQTYTNGSDLTGETLSFTATLGSSFDLRLRVTGVNISSTDWQIIAYGEDGTASSTEPGVEWDRDDGATTQSMTTETSDKVGFLPIDAASP